MTGAIVVMGVSGSGKSTLGKALAQRLGWRFLEGDSLHPPGNIAKMAAGIALNDTDRQPFLESVGAACAAGARTGGIVVSCSALKRRYRDLIRSWAPQVVFVLPVLTPEQLADRMAQRHDHFMPASLLQSQLATLELPEPDEGVVLVTGTDPTPVQLERVIAALPRL